MTDITSSAAAQRRRARIRASLGRRHLFEFIFRGLGILAILIGLGLVGSLFWMVISKGYPAFTQAKLSTVVYFDPEIIAVEAPPERQAGQPENERCKIGVTPLVWSSPVRFHKAIAA